MASLSKGVQLRLFLEEAKKSCKVEVYKEERWALKSMPEVVNGIPRYVYSRTTGKALSQSETTLGEIDGNAIMDTPGSYHSKHTSGNDRGRGKKHNVIGEEKTRG
jgi:hypothetical protein